MKKLLLTSIAALWLNFSFLTIPALAVDCNSPNLTTKEALQCGQCNASGVNCGDPQQSTSNINNTITKIINILSVVVGVIAVIMLIFGGLRFITSAGNEQGVKSAKNTVMYALVGLIVVVLAQVIVRFVLKTTVDSTNNTGYKTHLALDGGE